VLNSNEMNLSCILFITSREGEAERVPLFIYSRGS
jgi:hypothetical protein